MPLARGQTSALPPGDKSRCLGLLRGEDLEWLFREPGVSAAGFCRWQGQGHSTRRAELKKPSQDGCAPETMG